MGSAWEDVTHAVRCLAGRPGLVIASVLVLSSGVGTVTAVFTLINAVFLRPWSVHNPERLRWVYEAYRNGTYTLATDEELDAVAGQTGVFEGVAATSGDSSAWRTGNVADEITGERVTANYFDVLGVPASIGRTFSNQSVSADATPVVVTSDHLWHTRFRGDPSIVGRPLELPLSTPTDYHRPGRSYTIIGVTPPQFAGAFGPWRHSDYWVPVPIRRVDEQIAYGRTVGRVGVLIARLHPGVTTAQAHLVVAMLGAGVSRPAGANPSDRSLVLLERRAVALPHDLGGDRARAPCDRPAVDGGHSPVRGGRQHGRHAGGARDRSKTGSDYSHGARRRPLACDKSDPHRDGTAVAWRRRRGSRTVEPVRASARCGDADVHRTVDGQSRIVLRTHRRAGVVVCHGAVRADRAAGWSCARASGDTGESGCGAVRCAFRENCACREGPSARGTSRLTDRAVAGAAGGGVGRGNESGAHRTGRFRVRCGQRGYLRFQPARPSRQWICARDGARLRRNGGVPPALARSRSSLRHTVGAQRGPGNAHRAVHQLRGVTGRVRPGGVPIRVSYAEVSRGYFEALGLKLLHGRTFEAYGVSSESRVAIICEALARALWPGRDAIGQQLSFHWPDSTTVPVWLEVVGVAREVKDPLSEGQPNPFVYTPIEQDPRPWSLRLVARGQAPTPEVVREVQRLVVEAAPDALVSNTRTLESAIEELRYPRRAAALIVALSAAMALLVAGIGLYGLVSYWMGQRIAEIGIRSALGADHSAIVRLVLRDGFRLAGIGAFVGLALALAAVRIASSLVVALPPAGFAVAAALAGVLVATMGVACYVPARRAARVDPVVALRHL